MLRILIAAIVYNFIMGCAPMPAEAQVKRSDKLKAMAVRIAVEHKLDPKLFKAIIKQESNWKVNAVNKKTNDVGLGQISPHNVKAYKLDRERLLKDPEYNLRAAAVILSWFKKTYRAETHYYCRYNVGTGALADTKLANCLTYIAHIQKHLDKPTKVAGGQ